MHTYMYTIVYIYIIIYTCVCVCACVCLCIGFNFLRLSRLALNTAWWGSVAAESHVRTLKSILIVLAWICHLDAAFDPRWCQWLMVYDGLLLLCHWSTQRTATCRFGVRTHGKMSEELVTSTFEFKLVIYNCKMLSHVQVFFVCPWWTHLQIDFLQTNPKLHIPFQDSVSQQFVFFEVGGDAQFFSLGPFLCWSVVKVYWDIGCCFAGAQLNSAQVHWHFSLVHVHILGGWIVVFMGKCSFVCCLDSVLLQLKSNEFPILFLVTSTGIPIFYWYVNTRVVATDGIVCVDATVFFSWRKVPMIGTCMGMVQNVGIHR